MFLKPVLETVQLGLLAKLLVKAKPVSKVSFSWWNWVPYSIRLVAVHQPIVQIPHGSETCGQMQQKSQESKRVKRTREETLFMSYLSSPCSSHAYSGHWLIPRCDWQVISSLSHPDLTGHASKLELPFTPFQLINSQVIIMVSIPCW